MVKCRSQNSTVVLIKYTRQFYSDSHDTWHTNLSGVADVQDANFIRTKQVITELRALDFVKIGRK